MTQKHCPESLHTNLSFKNTGKISEMMRKVGLEADSGLRKVLLASRLRYAIITIQYISTRYYTALYCGDKENVLPPQKNSPPLHIDDRGTLRESPGTAFP